MAKPRRIKTKYGYNYRIEVCVSGIRKSGNFDTQSEACRWAEETEHLLRTGQPLPGEVSIGDMDFPEAVEKYTMAVASKKKPTTRQSDQWAGSRLIKHFGAKTLKEIQGKDIAAYRDYRLKSVGPSSVIQDMSMLACMYEMARVEWGLDVSNPEKDIKRPAPPKNRLVLLERENIDKLLDYCCVSANEKLYCYVMLCLQTAMRPGEAAGLKWQHVLWKHKIADLTITKTDPRRVPLTSKALQHLNVMFETRDKNNPFVFLPNDGKKRIRPSTFFRRSFDTAAKKAGLHGFTLYGLRHSAASYLIMNGVDIRTVAEIMGHRDINQTMKYTHFLDEHRVREIQVLNDLV